jgi:hypothetical protein
LEEPFPEVSIVPYPIHVKVHAVLVHEDETLWDVDHHPHLSGRPEATRVGDPDAPDVSFTLRSTYTLYNADAIRVTGHEMRGPEGHRPFRIHSDEDPNV